MVKATLRKPVSDQPLTGRAPIIDIEATVIPQNRDDANGAEIAKGIGGNVDDSSANALADALEAGADIPGSEEATTRETATQHTHHNQSVATARSVESGGAIEGEFDSSDLKMPQLKIVNGSGPLSQKYNQGTLLYADEALWLPPNLAPGVVNPTMRVIPLKIQKQFRENLTQDEMLEGLMPRIANSSAEARGMGGSTEWINNQKPRWSPSGRIIFLLEEPAGSEHPGFTLPLDGKNYALAVYYASGMGYGESIKVINNAAQVSLREAGQIVVHSRIWNFQVVKKKGGNFMVFVPSLKLTKETTGPDIRAMADLVLRKPPVETATE